MFDLYAKVGTGPGKIIRIKNKRKLPEIGTKIMFKFFPFEKYAKWEPGMIDEIRQVHDRIMYLVSRF